MGRGREPIDVWKNPRQPALERTDLRVKVVWPAQAGRDEVVIADTTNAYMVLETSHPPTYYIPQQDVDMSLLAKNRRSTCCEWKGAASYFDTKDPSGNTVASRIWTYENPSPRFAALKDHLCFYASPFRCSVDGEVVIAQPGDFYGGWMTSWVTGGQKGVKGGPGTWGW